MEFLLSSVLCSPTRSMKLEWQMDDSHVADTWNGFYKILSGMKRAEKTCFIHCAKFIVSFILLEFHKFLSVTWSMSICKSNLMLHWLNKDVTIFYAHQRLLRCQAQDILTGPVRLDEIQTRNWRPKLMPSSESWALSEAAAQMHSLTWVLAVTFRNSHSQVYYGNHSRAFPKGREYCFLSNIQ